LIFSGKSQSLSAEFFQNLFLLFVQLFGHGDLNLHIHIPAAEAVKARDALARNSENLSRFGAGGNINYLVI